MRGKKRFENSKEVGVSGAKIATIFKGLGDEDLAPDTPTEHNLTALVSLCFRYLLPLYKYAKAFVFARKWFRMIFRTMRIDSFPVVNQP
jgi:hypothetical protein